MKRLLLFILLVLVSPIQAAEIVAVHVERQDSIYRLTLHARLQASTRDIEAIITDYAHLMEINPFLKENRIEESDDENGTLVHLVTESCVLIFCRALRHDQRFQPMRGGVLVAEIVPEASDLKSGRMIWTVKPYGAGSELVMESEVTPDFVVPPVIGPYFMEKKLQEIALSTIQNIERVAAERAGR